MRDVIVLAMHGEPPRDFPQAELKEFFTFYAMQMFRSPMEPEARQRFAQLEERLRAWPRSPANDPFHHASLSMARALEQVAGYPVIVGFNEFCAPSIEDALEEAVGHLPRQVDVITPMLTPGGHHAQSDIPRTIAAVQSRHPEAVIRYVWPYDLTAVAEFLASHLQRSNGLPSTPPGGAQKQLGEWP